MSGSGISWTICKSAPCSRQTTTPAPHHSVFYRSDALPATQPTASKHWRLWTLWTLPTFLKLKKCLENKKRDQNRKKTFFYIYGKRRSRLILRRQRIGKSAASEQVCGVINVGGKLSDQLFHLQSVKCTAFVTAAYWSCSLPLPYSSPLSHLIGSSKNRLHSDYLTAVVIYNVRIISSCCTYSLHFFMIFILIVVCLQLWYWLVCLYVQNTTEFSCNSER